MGFEYLIDFNDFLNFTPSSIGNKAYNLALLKKKLPEVCIPRSFVITNVDKLISAPSYIGDLEKWVKTELNYPVIMRSSTNVEDSNDSFAGLFFSGICKKDDDLVVTLHKSLESITTDEVKAYCLRKRIDSSKINLAVLIQEYKKPQMSGVLFTKHPFNNDDTIAYIEYKEKTSDAVTSGSETPQSLILKKGKDNEVEDKFIKLLEYGIKIETAFKFPVDVEWVLSDDKLWFVQVRKITT